jgi:hypothetical protein
VVAVGRKNKKLRIKNNIIFWAQKTNFLKLKYPSTLLGLCTMQATQLATSYATAFIELWKMYLIL